MAEEDAATISSYIISLLKYLHSKGIVIRNLRPELLMFEDENSLEVKLIDLSLAVNISECKNPVRDPIFENWMRLPKTYLAPELFLAVKKYN